MGSDGANADSTDGKGGSGREVPSGGASSGSPRSLPVTGAPAAAIPTAVVRPAGGSAPQAHKSSLRVASYDRRSGRAVITGPAHAAPKPAPTVPAPKATPERSPKDAPKDAPRDVPKDITPTPPAPPAPSPSPNSSVAVGDVIASAPAPGAPNGVLAKVTQVLGKSGKGTEVNTAPATLSALLGDDKADGKVPVDPASVQVDPLVKGVKLSWAKNGAPRVGPHGAELPLGSLRLDVGTAIATAKDAPASAGASVSGFVQLSPQVEFSYNGTGSQGGSKDAAAPSGARIALSGDWSSQWQLKGQAAASTDGKPLRLPFAKLHADPVIQVGPVPVVVNLDLTCYLAVEADGKISVDIRQDLKGGFRVGGSYSWAKGWTPLNTSTLHSTPVRATATAAGKAKATLGAEAGIGLYGMAGVSADIAPYLRGEATAEATAATDGKASATASWKAFGGLDLTGTLKAHLSIFGTPLFEKRIPLGALHREWKLAEGNLTTNNR